MGGTKSRWSGEQGDVARLQTVDRLLVGLARLALGRCDEAGAELHAGIAHRELLDELPRIPHAAGGHERHAERSELIVRTHSPQGENVTLLAGENDGAAAQEVKPKSTNSQGLVEFNLPLTAPGCQITKSCWLPGAAALAIAPSAPSPVLLAQAPIDRATASTAAN